MKEEGPPLQKLIQEHLTDCYPSPYTRETYGQTLAGFCALLRGLGIRTPQAVKKTHVDAYGATLDGLAAATVVSRLHRVKRFFDWLLKKGILLTSPCDHLRLHKPRPPFIDPLTEDEVSRLLNAPDTATILGLRDRSMLETLYATGMRAGELLRLELADVDLAAETCFIRKGKGGHCRWVPLTEASAAFIQAYLDKARPALAQKTGVRGQGSGDRGTTTSFLFVSYQGGQISRQHLGVLCRHYAKKAGLEKKVWPHLLRHTAASHLLLNGAPFFHVQLLLGHAKAETTQGYTHINFRHLQETHARCHPRN